VPKLVVATSPSHDEPNQGLGSWMVDIVEHIENIDDLEIEVLSATDATPEKLFESIANRNPDFIALNGHGDYKSVYGHDDVLLVCSDNDLEGFSGRIIHALACDAGKELGPALKDLNAQVLLGDARATI